MLDAFHGSIEGFNRPILETIGPGELVKLDEIHTEGIDFQDVLVDGLSDVHGAVATGLVVQIVGGLGEYLNARILDLRRFIRGLLQGFSLFHHDRSMPPDFLC